MNEGSNLSAGSGAVHIANSATAKGLHSNPCTGFEGSRKALKGQGLFSFAVGLQIALANPTQ
jgi:hypothetical protein